MADLKFPRIIKMTLTIIPIAIPNNKLLNKMAMIVTKKGIN
jgi:hypothetical protein